MTCNVIYKIIKQFFGVCSLNVDFKNSKKIFKISKGFIVFQNKSRYLSKNVIWTHQTPFQASKKFASQFIFENGSKKKIDCMFWTKAYFDFTISCRYFPTFSEDNYKRTDFYTWRERFIINFSVFLTCDKLTGYKT